MSLWSRLPSFTSVVSFLFLAYMANSLYSIAQLFLPPACPPAGQPGGCLDSLLSSRPGRSLLLFSTPNPRPSLGPGDLTFLAEVGVADPEAETSLSVSVPLPKSVRQNGTLYFVALAVPALKSSDNPKKDWLRLIQSDELVTAMTPLTVHQVPEAATFNLLGDDDGASASQPPPKDARTKDAPPVTHLRSKLTLSFMTGDVGLPPQQLPVELHHLVRTRGKKSKDYLPVLYLDELSLRLRDLRKVNQTDDASEVEVAYRPISYGKLRLFLQFSSALTSMHSLGFTPKDTDEVKGIFADTNLALLLVTFGVSAVHLLFDFLAFKNEISFWRRKSTMEGLSTTTVMWRAFSQGVVFLYLLDEDTSLLVLIPSGVAAIIEVWKVTKVFKVSWSYSTGLVFGQHSDKEKTTDQFDSESMRYLSYLLYPLCIGGAAYSLLYQPHKSWYSWTVHSLVNGVYAFGFLFMLPQLFVNYRLKSVAHLPWRAFMYKAFNTFIDDLFAFVITMPTAHRVACFRDDIVFLIYLYQRYLYPVDKTRVDASGMIEETPEGAEGPAAAEKKKQ